MRFLEPNSLETADFCLKTRFLVVFATYRKFITSLKFEKNLVENIIQRYLFLVLKNAPKGLDLLLKSSFKRKNRLFESVENLNCRLLWKSWLCRSEFAVLLCIKAKKRGK